MAFITAGDYITEAKGLTNDVDGVRYPITRYYQALNSGLAEAYRVRPDFFRGLTEPPHYNQSDENTTINWPRHYAFPLLIYLVGHLELTDTQGNKDERASALATTFVAKLTRTAA